ncbi:hypothetical protein BKA64DRAFT_61936 [Cadophora sp. MPI-SDFR-AT-0126]|nr:hypothetical protein BKA64DRAFT_61936 [Leotiomycetes sp. MPI-SDFR-AT-0126]
MPHPAHLIGRPILTNPDLTPKEAGAELYRIHESTLCRSPLPVISTPHQLARSTPSLPRCSMEEARRAVLVVIGWVVDAEIDFDIEAEKKNKRRLQLNICCMYYLSSQLEGKLERNVTFSASAAGLFQAEIAPGVWVFCSQRRNHFNNNITHSSLKTPLLAFFQKMSRSIFHTYLPTVQRGYAAVHCRAECRVRMKTNRRPDAFLEPIEAYLLLSPRSRAF